MIEKKIKILQKNKTNDAKISYSEEPPWLVTLIVSDNIKISSEAGDLFKALEEVRKKALQREILLLCNGARSDVYPSPMSRSMSGGMIAYKLTLGQQAKRADILNIFDYAEQDFIVSPEEQENFYTKWLTSLK